MTTVFSTMSTKNKNIVNFYADKTDSCDSLATAMNMAKKHCITIEFHSKCVCATKRGHSECVKFSLFENEDDAVILAVNDCVDYFSGL